MELNLPALHRRINRWQGLGVMNKIKKGCTYFYWNEKQIEKYPINSA